MADFKTADRVYETSTTTGTGEYTLAGAVTGFQAVSVIGANNYGPFFITDDTNWEVIIGTYVTGPSRLQRTAVMASSNGGAAVNWGAGTRKIRCGMPAWLGAPRQLDKDVAGGVGTTVLTADEQRRRVLNFTGALTGNRTIEVDTTKWDWSVYNNTTGAFTLTVKTNAGTGIAVTQGKRAILHCDGVNVVTRHDDITAINDGIVTAAKLATGAVTAIKLAGSALAFVGMVNGTIAASRAGNAETVAVKTLAGTDPSATDPVHFVFRNVTAGTGDYVVLSATAALSLTISSGSTLGATNSIPFRVWLVVFNDGGTLRLGLVNTQLSDGIQPLRDYQLASSTAEGGAGAADSAGVIYTGSAVAAKAMRLLGYLEYTLATVGTWNTAPSAIQIFGPGIAMPGDTVQERANMTGAVATGTTVLPHDDTIPQNTEGDQYMSQAITPTSTINQLEIEHGGGYNASVAATVTAALFQDSTANALAAVTDYPSGPLTLNLLYRMRAATVSATTFKIRAGAGGAGTTTFNGTAAARTFGGVWASYLKVREIMA